MAIKFTLQRGGFYGTFATFGLGLMTFLFLWVPFGQHISGREVQWEVLYCLPMFGYFWYMRLKPVKAVLIHEDGRVEFQRGCGGSEVSIASIKRIRPMFGLSGRSFVLHHSSGAELLFEDPTAVSCLGIELRSRNPAIELRGVPEPPGNYDARVS